MKKSVLELHNRLLVCLLILKPSTNDLRCCSRIKEESYDYSSRYAYSLWSKWSNTLKQFVGKSQRIVWMFLTILWDWHLKERWREGVRGGTKNPFNFQVVFLMSVACYMFILYVIIFKRIIRKAKMLEKDEVERIKSKNVYFFFFFSSFFIIFILWTARIF